MLAPSGAPGLQSVCLLSLLDDDTRYSERAQQREGGGGTRDDKFVKKVIEALGTQSGHRRVGCTRARPFLLGGSAE